MTAVSKKLTLASSAASTTARVPASSTLLPKLLQPTPTTETSSEPMLRVSIVGRSVGRSADEERLRAVDDDLGAGHVARGVGGEEEHDRRDVVGAALATVRQRDLARWVLGRLLLALDVALLRALLDLRRDTAWTDHVHANAVLRQLEREHLRHRDLPRLRRGIRRRPGVAEDARPVDGRGDDHRAAARTLQVRHRVLDRQKGA